MASGSKSLKEYLKRYESNNVDEKKKKKKKKDKRGKAETSAAGAFLVVDEDPVWQKPVNLAEEENDDDSADEAKPQIDEDIEVKRMKRLEQLRLRRPLNYIAEDGSGWVTLSPKRSNSVEQNADISPPRRLRTRNDTPSPEPEQRRQDTPSPDGDISPPRRRRARNDTPSPEPNRTRSNIRKEDDDTQLHDMSPPRRRRARNDTPSPEPSRSSALQGREDDDLSPPRQRNRSGHTLSPDISPPRRSHSRITASRDQEKSERHESPDLSPPRRGRRGSQDMDLSPPRRGRENTSDLSPPRRRKKDSVPMESNERRKGGLISAQDTRKEIAKTKDDEWLRFQAMDPSLTGKGAEPVARDKLTGRRLTKEEMQKSKEEEKPKEKKLEWGKGLAQKKEAEERIRELELEKEKPFARTRDDPELDKMLKERVRWGDPMAHLVKRKNPELVLADLGDSEKMKESGFIIPQEIPSHSWLKRGGAPAPNRYGIRPGRHWDGVDRSNGFENQLFKRTNEKRATEREAYLWSVSDM